MSHLSRDKISETFLIGGNSVYVRDVASTGCCLITPCSIKLSAQQVSSVLKRKLKFTEDIFPQGFVTPYENVFCAPLVFITNAHALKILMRNKMCTGHHDKD